MNTLYHTEKELKICLNLRILQDFSDASHQLVHKLCPLSVVEQGTPDFN